MGEIAAESLCTDGTALETPEENGQNTPYTSGSPKSTRRTLESQLAHLVIFTCRDTCIWISGLPVENVSPFYFELYVYIKARLMQNLTCNISQYP